MRFITSFFFSFALMVLCTSQSFGFVLSGDGDGSGLILLEASLDHYEVDFRKNEVRYGFGSHAVTKKILKIEKDPNHEDSILITIEGYPSRNRFFASNMGGDYVFFMQSEHEKVESLYDRQPVRYLRTSQDCTDYLTNGGYLWTGRHSEN